MDWPVGLTERAEAIARELSRFSTSIHVAECSIFFENIYFENLVLTNCNHEFHAECIQRAIETMGSNCSICRRQISVLYRPILKLRLAEMFV